ncbi:MAG: pyridoxal-phosphate dependent enzyme [Thermoanaerobaculia bacterium]
MNPRPTTIVDAPKLAARLGVDLFLAVETFQITGSFKYRAALEVARSVPHPILLTASSGNFGQAIAAAAAATGKRAVVVMPTTSARVKIDAVRAYGATVDLVDTTRVPRAERIRQLADQYPEAYVGSAFDDPHVIRGNSSLGRELAALARPFDAVVVPLGGGGLTAGTIVGLRAGGHAAAVYGAEPSLANDGARSLAAGHIVRNESEPPTIADGARTLALGERNWAILKDGIAGIVEVSEERIADGLRALFALANLKAEPTGALAVGALLAVPEKFRDRRVCCIVSGGNVDPALYAGLIAS